MRETLFRGKRKDTGALITSDSILQYNGLIKLWDKEDGWVDVESETVDQYTGLSDNNGNKIFEGDIVRTICEDGNGVIEWNDDDAAYWVTYKGFCLSFVENLCGRDVEVIGNIHDNPELAEGLL